LNDIVEFVGDVRHDRIPTYMTMCDVFVLPSKRESFGIVLLEAMAAGRPCVASNVGGIPEIIEDKKNGVLVAPGDEKGLAEGIRRILNTQEIADLYERENREKVEDYSWERLIRRFEELF